MEPVRLDHHGVQLTGELYAPTEGEVRPCVLVMHNALGLGPHVREICGRLVALGYAALATDMYGDGFAGDPAEAGQRYLQFIEDPALMRTRSVAWFDRAKALPRIAPRRVAAIGYCFGGQCVLELARSGADVKAVASFHGILKTHAPTNPGAIKGEVAVWCGGRDPYAPQSDIEALRTELSTANARHQITVFANAEHSYTDPDAAALGRPGISYDALADAVSWAGTVAMLGVAL